MFILREILSILVSGISLYSTLLTVWIIIRILMHFGAINYYSSNNVVQSGIRFLDSIMTPPLEKIRNYIPSVFGNIDFSPIILYFALGILKTIILKILYQTLY